MNMTDKAGMFVKKKPLPVPISPKSTVSLYKISNWYMVCTVTLLHITGLMRRNCGRFLSNVPNTVPEHKPRTLSTTNTHLFPYSILTSELTSLLRCCFLGCWRDEDRIGDESWVLLSWPLPPRLRLMGLSCMSSDCLAISQFSNVSVNQHRADVQVEVSSSEQDRHSVSLPLLGAQTTSYHL